MGRNKIELLSLTGSIVVLFVAASCAAVSEPSEGPEFVLDLETAGQITRVFVFDPGRVVVEARPADDLEAAAAEDTLFESDVVAFRHGSDDVVIVAWLVTPCDRQTGLTIAAAIVTVELAPRRGCDALAIVRAVALRFVDPAHATRLEARLIPAIILPEVELRTPVAPPPTAEG